MRSGTVGYRRGGNGPPLMAPLKIGILGAARIADDGIVEHSRVLGHRG